MAGGRSGQWTTLVAPAAFLLGITIAVLLVRSALNDDGTPARATQPAPAHKVANPGKGPRTPGGKQRFTIVRAGDTFSTIAARSGITVARLERLNPGVRSTALFIGQRIRVG